LLAGSEVGGQAPRDESAAGDSDTFDSFFRQLESRWLSKSCSKLSDDSDHSTPRTIIGEIAIILVIRE
jgi:hypothetical protein